MKHIVIAGRLGNDPETRFTSGGQKVTTFRVATNHRRSKNEETVWWRITIWGDTFDKMLPYLKKGSAVMVSGDFAPPEIYTDKNGQPQVSLGITASELSFSPFGKSEGGEQQPREQMQPAASASPGMGAMPGPMPGSTPDAMSDDDIPF